MLMAEKERTWTMMIASISATMIGKILASAALALADSSIGPPVSMR
jgi:hypothetical protein